MDRRRGQRHANVTQAHGLTSRWVFPVKGLSTKGLASRCNSCPIQFTVSYSFERCIMASLLNWFGLQGIQSTIRRIQAEQAAKKLARVPKPKRTWACLYGVVQAHTKSEARAMFKKSRGLKRLPVGVVVDEVEAM